jgi:hypothetical protein
MLSSFEAGLLLSPGVGGVERFSLTPTGLESEPIPWTELAEALCKVGDAYVCLIILDDSVQSRRFGEVLQRNYMRIDQITGGDLIVLTTVPPPAEWFRLKASLFCTLPEQTQRFVERSISYLGTSAGAEDARYASHQLIGEFFEDTIKAPAICYLRPAAAGAPTEGLDAVAFEIGGFQTEGAIVGMFSYLARVAHDKREEGADAKELAAAAHAIGSPRSLRWRNAAYRVLSSYELLLEWLARGKRLRGT